MNPNPHTNRACGFRISWLDALILVLGAVLSWWLMNQSFPLWWIIPAALGHFFLFCNVFLVWRRLELLWAAAFVLNVATHVAFNEYDSWPSLVWQTPVTLAVIACQMRSPWYHGVFAKRLNSRIEEYLNAKIP
jgi:hypothetical protein